MRNAIQSGARGETPVSMGQSAAGQSIIERWAGPWPNMVTATMPQGYARETIGPRAAGQVEPVHISLSGMTDAGPSLFAYLHGMRNMQDHAMSDFDFARWWLSLPAFPHRRSFGAILINSAASMPAGLRDYLNAIQRQYGADHAAAMVEQLLTAQAARVGTHPPPVAARPLAVGYRAAGQLPSPAGYPSPAGQLRIPVPTTATPSNMGPADGSLLHSSAIRFKWTMPVDAPVIKVLQLAICTDAALTTACVPVTDLRGDATQVFIPLQPGQYFWSVRAQGMDGTWSAPSAPSMLKIDSAVTAPEPGDLVRGKGYMQSMAGASSAMDCDRWHGFDHGAKAHMLDSLAPGNGTRTADPSEPGYEDSRVEQAIADVDAYCAALSNGAPPAPPPVTPPGPPVTPPGPTPDCGLPSIPQPTPAPGQPYWAYDPYWRSAAERDAWTAAHSACPVPAPYAPPHYVVVQAPAAQMPSWMPMAGAAVAGGLLLWLLLKAFSTPTAAPAALPARVSAPPATTRTRSMTRSMRRRA